MLQTVVVPLYCYLYSNDVSNCSVVLFGLSSDVGKKCNIRKMDSSILGYVMN